MVPQAAWRSTQCMIYGAQNGRRIINDHMIKLVIQGELL